MYYSTKYDSPLGKIIIASDEKNIVALWLENQKYFGDMGDAKATADAEQEGFIEVGAGSGRQSEQEMPEPLKMAVDWLERYFNGQAPEIKELPLAPEGGEFRQRVWKILCEIPYGQVTTYGEIAKKMAALMGKDRMSAQAVGGAVGRNPISIIIPCHRVVGSSGSLTGYAGGIQTKVKLLQHEGVDMSGLFVPKKGTAL